MKPGIRLAISCAVLLGALAILQLRSTGAVPIRRSLDSFPDAIGGWQAREDSFLGAEVENSLKVDDYVIRRYADEAGDTIWLYVGYWASQRRGGAQVHSPRNCLPGAGWEPVEASRLVIELPGRGPLSVNRYLIQKDQHMQVVLYWYHAQGKPVAGEVAAKIGMMRSAVFQNRTDGALVRLSSPALRGVPETTERLVHYVQAVYPILGEYLPD
jgi:EpsI family protein